MTPYSRQNVTEEDIEAVVAVLKSDFLTQGAVVPAFERKISALCDANYGVAACNATAALHLACLGLNVDSESLVWVPAVSFVASANCARYCGAEVDFVDVDPATGLLGVEALKQKLDSVQRRSGDLPKALIVVHLAGQSCDMQAIHSLCQPLGIAIIEDACHALGGYYGGHPIGDCRFSNCAVFSFHPVKPITSAEGGMLVTNDAALAERARVLSSHGIVRDQKEFKNQPPGGWYYEQQYLGFNYRLSDVHAALGLSQANRLREMVLKKAALAQSYERLISERCSNITPAVNYAPIASAWHLYPILFPSRAARDIAFELLRNAGYGVNIHYEPIPSQPYYSDINGEQSFTGADLYTSRTLSLPLFENLDVQVLPAVVELVREALSFSEAPS